MCYLYNLYLCGHESKHADLDKACKDDKCKVEKSKAADRKCSKCRDKAGQKYKYEYQTVKGFQMRKKVPVEPDKKKTSKRSGAGREHKPSERRDTSDRGRESKAVLEDNGARPRYTESPERFAEPKPDVGEQLKTSGKHRTQRKDTKEEGRSKRPSGGRSTEDSTYGSFDSTRRHHSSRDSEDDRSDRHGRHRTNSKNTTRSGDPKRSRDVGCDRRDESDSDVEHQRPKPERKPTSNSKAPQLTSARRKKQHVYEDVELELEMNSDYTKKLTHHSKRSGLKKKVKDQQSDSEPEPPAELSEPETPLVKRRDSTLGEEIEDNAGNGETRDGDGKSDEESGNESSDDPDNTADNQVSDEPGPDFD